MWKMSIWVKFWWIYSNYSDYCQNENKATVAVAQWKKSHTITPLTVLYTLRKTQEMSHQVANEKFMTTDLKNKQKPNVGLREI